MNGHVARTIHLLGTSESNSGVTVASTGTVYGKWYEVPSGLSFRATCHQVPTSGTSEVTYQLYLGASNHCPSVNQPTVTNKGTAGGSTQTYAVVPVYNGTLTGDPSPTKSTATGNATLSATNYNRIAWEVPSGARATSFNIYRTAGGPSQGLIATVPGSYSFFDDMGAAGDSAALPNPKCYEVITLVTSRNGNDTTAGRGNISTTALDRPFTWVMGVATGTGGNPASTSASLWLTRY